MVNPKIVYCKKRHIYDAAIDKDCPYCRKIEEDHKRLSKIVNESERIYDKDEEYTELIVDSPKLQEEDEEYTELIGSRQSEGIVNGANQQGEDEEYTELIRNKRNDAEDDKTELLVIDRDIEQQDVYQSINLRGWLVCVSGADLGKSFELRSGDNFVYQEKDNKISVHNIAQNNKTFMGLLYDQEENGVLVMKSYAGAECQIDGASISKECILESYSHIRWEQMEFIFVKFLNN